MLELVLVLVLELVLVLVLLGDVEEDVGVVVGGCQVVSGVQDVVVVSGAGWS